MKYISLISECEYTYPLTTYSTMLILLKLMNLNIERVLTHKRASDEVHNQ